MHYSWPAQFGVQAIAKALTGSNHRRMNSHIGGIHGCESESAVSLDLSIPNVNIYDCGSINSSSSSSSSSSLGGAFTPSVSTSGTSGVSSGRKSLSGAMQLPLTTQYNAGSTGLFHSQTNVSLNLTLTRTPTPTPTLTRILILTGISDMSSLVHSNTVSTNPNPNLESRSYSQNEISNNERPFRYRDSGVIGAVCMEENALYRCISTELSILQALTEVLKTASTEVS